MGTVGTLITGTIVKTQWSPPLSIVHATYHATYDALHRPMIPKAVVLLGYM